MQIHIFLNLIKQMQFKQFVSSMIHKYYKKYRTLRIFYVSAYCILLIFVISMKISSLEISYDMHRA